MRAMVRKGRVELNLDKNDIKYLIRDPFLPRINIHRRLYNHGQIHALAMLKVRNFLIEQPLIKVPLFINEFPDFAKWRLRIAK